MAGQLDPIWVPNPTDIARARVSAFAEFAARTTGYRGSSYLDVWQWSVTKLDDFWDAVWKLCGVTSPIQYRRTEHDMFAGRRPNTVAIIDIQEHTGSQQQTRRLTWAQLHAEMQAINPQDESPSEIRTTIPSPGAAS